MRLSLCNLCVLVLLFTLPGCGVVYSYVNNEDKFEKPLSMLMTKSDVEDILGKPGKVVKDNGRIVVWEYRLYSRYHWVKELFACPFTAWLGGCFFYPSIGVGDPNYPSPYFVVLQDDHLCVWGPLEFVNTSKTCQAPPMVSSQARGGGT